MNNTLEILKGCEAFLEGHFLLSSGKHSGGYCQCAKLLRFPDKAATVLAPVVEKLKDLNITKVCGPAMGGVVVSYEVARQLGTESIFTERKDGEMQLRRGFEVGAGDNILITEDVITTGKSTIETIDALEKLGAKVVGILCVADRRAGKFPMDVPVFSAIELNIEAHDPDDCPICKDGKIDLVKPGSREMKK